MATDLRGYNERLFSGGLRKHLHTSRYLWLTREISKLHLTVPQIIELGCFDGKTIEYLEYAGISIGKYYGYDANWEGGLDIGKQRWLHRPNICLEECTTPEQMRLPDSSANIGICMETFEHVPEDLVEPYLARLQDIVKGYLFITVPVERGSMFFLRHMAKRLLGMEDYQFTRSEFWGAAFSRMTKVARDGHKGFDDRVLVRQVGKYFDIVKVCGILPGIPLHTMNFNIGIVAKSR